MSIIIAFFVGMILNTLVDAFADWLEAIADRIMVENEERRARLKIK